MPRLIRYLTHPQVEIDPNKDVPSWSLNAVGCARVEALCTSGKLDGLQAVISSAEQKAVETGKPLADAVRCQFEMQEKMHENDRSATGFLPPAEFESVADQFFAAPDTSIRGWETARAAQARIVGEVRKCLVQYPEGDLLFVGHGGVGTLLYCHLAGKAISREHDQGPGGGGCFIAFSEDDPTSVQPWRPMDASIDRYSY